MRAAILPLALVFATPAAARDSLVIFSCTALQTCSTDRPCRKGSARATVGVVQGNPMTNAGVERYFVGFASGPNVGTGTLYETEVPVVAAAEPGQMIAAAGEERFGWFRSAMVDAPLHLHYVHPETGLFGEKDTLEVTEFACQQEMF